MLTLVVVLASLLLILGQKAYICISCAKVDRSVKVIPKWNQADISNTICARKIKSDLHGLLEGMFREDKFLKN